MTATSDRRAASALPARARRLQRPRWLDPRLVISALLVLASVVIGARVFASAGTTTPVWEAVHALAPGEQLTPADVTIAQVRLGAAQHSYVSAASPLPAGYVVVQPIGARQLLPFAAVAPSRSHANTRLVAVPVAEGHFDTALAPGDVVDVYVTPRGSGTSAVGPTRLVYSGATVDGRQGTGLGGTTATVLVSVPASAVTALVQAGETGSIDLVDDPSAGAGYAP